MANSDQSVTTDQPRAKLGAFDLTCLGWNSVIGSGVFLTQGQIAAAVGPFGPLMFLVGGLCSLPIALCFGDLARRYPGTGGSSLFAHHVFGPRTGFVVGWVMWLSGLIGGATVSLGFSEFVLGLAQQPKDMARPLAMLLLTALALINWSGTRGGAWCNNALSMGKLLPITLAAVVALFWIGPVAVLHPVVAAPEKMAWLAGLLAVLYTYSGFEEIALPAGEVRDSQRHVPRATLVVLGSSALLYTILQGFVSHQGAATADQPLQQAFSSVPWLAQLLMLAGVISFASVNASIAFTTPRSLWTLAHHGWLPTRLRQLDAASGAPRPCIAISLALALLLLLTRSLDRLIALSVLASLLQHLSTSLASWKIRGWASSPGVPQLAVATCLLLLCTSSRGDLLGMLVSLALGALVSALARPPRHQEVSSIDESQDPC